MALTWDKPRSRATIPAGGAVGSGAMTTATPREDGPNAPDAVKPAPVRIVLVRPRNPENLGAVARAMRNFGLGDWAIAALGTHDFAAARRVAVHAEELLDRPRLTATLDEAVADCAWVVGTSARKVRGKRRLLPEEVAREASARAPGVTAIVFGEERSGLTGEEVDRCHDLSTIPVDEAQPSLNLAQAVLVYAYEARRAGGAPPPGREGALATDGDLARIEEALRRVLRDGGFLAGPERHAIRDLADVLRRGRMSPREARLWEAALRALGKRLPGV
jgi:tRNA/rRNA methyltransferase